MTTKAKKDEAMELQPIDEAPVVSMFERLARDPEVDVEKMERLIAMQRDVAAQQAKMAYTQAFAEMQGELPEIPKIGKSNTGRYAKFEHIQRAVRPILERHGFALSFRYPKGDGVGVTAVLSHVEGHSEETTMFAPADTSGNKTGIHAMASTSSYLKRYTAAALLNIVAVDEDDDAASAEAPEPPDGYESFKADMDSVAEEGAKAFGAAFKKADEKLRAHGLKHDKADWDRMKKKAQEAA